MSNHTHSVLRSRLTVLGAVAGLSLALAAVALAVAPKAGAKYTGFTSAPTANGFKAPVSFTVAHSGGNVLSFTYGDTGCPGGTLPAGNPYLQSADNVKVGAIHLTKAGVFSVKNVKRTTSTIAVQGGEQVNYTISTVKGKFTTKKIATGTITFTNGFTVPGFSHVCGDPITQTFKATTK